MIFQDAQWNCVRMPVRLIRLAHVFIYFSPDSDLLGVLLIREMPGATVGSLRAVFLWGFSSTWHQQHKDYKNAEINQGRGTYKNVKNPSDYYWRRGCNSSNLCIYNLLLDATKKTSTFQLVARLREHLLCSTSKLASLCSWVTSSV